MLSSRAFTPALALAFLAPFAALASDEGCTRGDGKVCARACGEGDAIACWLLGTMHRDGMGVRRDQRRAAALYEQACIAGATVGCLYAAAVYTAGQGVKKDESRATALLGSCAKKDSNGCGPACPSPAPSATPASPDSSSAYDQPPRPVKMVKPPYPQYAFDEKIEGTVVVQILISASGKVTDACIMRSVPYLDPAALEAVYQWRFSPAIKNGAPVATIAQAPVSFRIH